MAPAADGRRAAPTLSDSSAPAHPNELCNTGCITWESIRPGAGSRVCEGEALPEQQRPVRTTHRFSELARDQFDLAKQALLGHRRLPAKVELPLRRPKRPF